MVYSTQNVYSVTQKRKIAVISNLIFQLGPHRELHNKFLVELDVLKIQIFLINYSTI